MITQERPMIDGMNNLFNTILSWVLKRRMDQVHYFMENPHEVQQQIFSRLIDEAKDTVWGRQYEYHSIKSPEEYRNRVPIFDYDRMKPWIERVMRGEQQVLWPQKVKWFAKSSGTTSDKSKFIPVTKDALEECHFKAGKDLMAIYCDANPDTKVFSGKGLIMGGSSQVNQLDGNANSRYGDVSAVMMHNMPLLASLIKTPDLSIALLDEWEEKIEQMAQTTIEQNVTHIAGVPTWTLVLFEKIFELTGKDNIADIWPNLELYIHGGVSFTPYRERFKELIRSSGMNYLETYNASEGFFGLQNDLNTNDLLLMLDYGIYYEFIPAEEIGKEYPKAVGLEQVETDQNYAMVISSNGGLWRYLIGDTVQFTSIRPYKIKISGRTRHFINAFGEEVIIENADSAITHACQATGAVVKDYTAAPVYFSGKEKGSHEWLIEFDQTPDSLVSFTVALDTHLKSINSDYEAKRYKDMALQMPKVHAVEQGTFYNWLKSKGKLGGQHKVPRLSNDRRYLEELLAFHG